MKNSEKSAKTAVKKVFVFALLIAALSGAVYFNWQYTSKSGSIAVSGAAKNTQKYLAVNRVAYTCKRLFGLRCRYN